MNEINLRCLDFYDVINELQRIIDNNKFKKIPSVKTKCDGIEIPYYELGQGDNHIVVVGGTHGSEIISVDFVLRLMEQISKKEGAYSNIDLESNSGYTFHFLPLLNPEGYIVASSAIRKLIPKDASEEKIEQISKEYFLKYRQDDINAKKNPEDRNQKLHQQMFDSVTFEDIPEEFKGLREKIKEIYSNPEVPKGSIIVHRGNGYGEETNRSQLSKALSNSTNNYYSNRYNNINRNIPGPLGIIPDEELPENKFLKNLLSKLYKEQKYTGMLTYHSTGGMIYSKLSDDDELLLDEELPNSYLEEKYRNSIVNRILTKKYQEDTKYTTEDGIEKSGYKVVEIPSLADSDEVLRLTYPALLLIELSYMGGNPIGPLGDKTNNYVPTIESNLKAAYNFFRTCKYLKNVMYNQVTLIDEEMAKPNKK